MKRGESLCIAIAVICAGMPASAVGQETLADPAWFVPVSSVTVSVEPGVLLWTAPLVSTGVPAREQSASFEVVSSGPALTVKAGGAGRSAVFEVDAGGAELTVQGLTFTGSVLGGTGVLELDGEDGDPAVRCRVDFEPTSASVALAIPEECQVPAFRAFLLTPNGLGVAGAGDTLPVPDPSVRINAPASSTPTLGK